MPKKLNPVGHRKAKLVEGEVSNPNYSRSHDGAQGNPRTIRVLINAFESPIEYWYRDNHIDEAQYLAGTAYRRWFEMIGGKGAGAMDYSRPKVDGGGAFQVQMETSDAHSSLKMVEALFGAEYWMIQRVCGECQPMNVLFKKSHERRAASRRIRGMLRELAEELGYRTKQRKAG